MSPSYIPNLLFFKINSINILLIKWAKKADVFIQKILFDNNSIYFNYINCLIILSHVLTNKKSISKLDFWAT